MQASAGLAGRRVGRWRRGLAGDPRPRQAPLSAPQLTLRHAIALLPFLTCSMEMKRKNPHARLSDYKSETVIYVGDR